MHFKKLTKVHRRKNLRRRRPSGRRSHQYICEDVRNQLRRTPHPRSEGLPVCYTQPCGFLLSDIILSRTFNEFFYRKLKPSARPPASPMDPTVICSAADCRLMVFNDVTAARTFWFVGYFSMVPYSRSPRIKGKSFTIPALLGSPTLARRFTPLSSLAVFRLAPQVCLALFIGGKPFLWAFLGLSSLPLSGGRDN